MLPILAVGTAALALLQAALLALSPRLLIYLLANSAREPTEVETYLCHSAAAGLLALAGLSLCVPRLALEADDGAFTVMVLSMTVYHVLAGVLAYLRYTSPDHGAGLYGLLAAASVVLAGAGVGVLIFGKDAATKGSGWMFPDEAKLAKKADKKKRRGLA